MAKRELSHNTTMIPTLMESASEAGVQGRAECYPRQISSTVSFPFQSRENYSRTPARITAGRQRGSDVESRSSPLLSQTDRLTVSDGDDRDSAIRSKGQHLEGRGSQRQNERGATTSSTGTKCTTGAQTRDNLDCGELGDPGRTRVRYDEVDYDKIWEEGENENRGSEKFVYSSNEPNRERQTRRKRILRRNLEEDSDKSCGKNYRDAQT